MHGCDLLHFVALVVHTEADRRLRGEGCRGQESGAMLRGGICLLLRQGVGQEHASHGRVSGPGREGERVQGDQHGFQHL